MPKCFVIQPFNDKYQKLYVDVYRDAIGEAELEPYKVDEDEAASIPIEAIEANLRNVDVCFAEISEMNANVWFELGYAIASKKPICIICAKQSVPRLPFDIQHRAVIFYDNESPSDFIQLKAKITKRLTALKKEITYAAVTTEDINPVSGALLKDHELTALAVVAAEQNGMEGSVSVSEARNGMERAGYTAVAAALAMRNLIAGGMLEEFEADAFNDHSYRACRLTDAGWTTLNDNESKLNLRSAKGKAQTTVKSKAAREPDFDDEIPF